MDLSIDTLRTAVTEMKDLGVRRLRTPDGFEIELHESAFEKHAPVVADEPPPAPKRDANVCACSHDLDIEHSNEGCLLGCHPLKCASKDTEPEHDGPKE